MGHSMGAAPILSAAPILQKKGYKIPGVSVLDVVEGMSHVFPLWPLALITTYSFACRGVTLIKGTAVEALPLMKSILSSRPSTFKSVVDAIHWQ